MFSDPYSERQELYGFLSRNKIFISLALILIVVAVLELALLFRLPRKTAEAEAEAGSTAGPVSSRAAEADDAGENRASTETQAQESLEGNWRLVLVNETHPLPEDFVIRLITIRNGIQVDERILDPLNRMIEAAGADGLTIVIASAYRSVERQQELYDNKVYRLQAQGLSEEQARIEAVKEVAYPGTSEHHLGLAVDLVAYRYQWLDEGQADTEENRWLQAHCQEFGFILRYPPGKSELTGVIYEPWHFRYVGMEAVRYMGEQGICLEEYWDGAG